MNKYQYQIYHKLDRSCHPMVRYKILWIFWSKWYYMESIGGTAVYLYPDMGKGYTEERALEVIEEHKDKIHVK